MQIEKTWVNEPIPDGLETEFSVPANLFKKCYMCNGLLQLYFLNKGMDEFWSYVDTDTYTSPELKAYIAEKGADSLFVARALAYWNLLGRYTYLVSQETIDKYVKTEDFTLDVAKVIESVPTCMWFDLQLVDLPIIISSFISGIVVYKDYVLGDNDTEDYLELDALILGTDGTIVKHQIGRYTEDTVKIVMDSDDVLTALVEYVLQSFVTEWTSKIGDTKIQLI